MNRLIKLGRFWLGGVRIYIAAASVLLTLVALWWTRTVFGGTQLEIIRLQEIYAWTSLGFLTLALLVGPVTKLFPGIRGKSIIFDSRRALGLSAAWFALLHAAMTYFKQFQAINPLQLPSAYQQAMLLGVIVLAILGAMAATSVNTIMKSWGIWWFRLHRLVYAAVILALVHAFMIGAHAAETTALIVLSSLALLWIVLNIAILIKSSEVKTGRVMAICFSIIILAGTLTYGLNQRFEQIRSDNQGHGHQ